MGENCEGICHTSVDWGVIEKKDWERAIEATVNRLKKRGGNKGVVAGKDGVTIYGTPRGRGVTWTHV